MKLKDKTAVITGGNNGIGLATAREFRANGAKVTIFGRDQKTLAEAALFGFDKRGLVFRMHITRLDPGKQVVMLCNGDHPEWTGTTLTWTIDQQDDKAVLHLNHSAWKDVTDFCASCNSMWRNLMYRLKAYVEGRNPGPQWIE